MWKKRAIGSWMQNHIQNREEEKNANKQTKEKLWNNPIELEVYKMNHDDKNSEHSKLYKQYASICAGKLIECSLYISHQCL